MFHLPEQISATDFDQQIEVDGPLLQALQAAAQTIAKHCNLAQDLHRISGGANAVFACGQAQVIKLFPPFQRYQWETELRVLKALKGQSLPVTFPEWIYAAEANHWGYIVMSFVPGHLLQTVWPELSEKNKLTVLSQIGQLMRAVHQLPSESLPELDPPWELYWDYALENYLARHRSQGLPAGLLESLPTWLQGQLPSLEKKAGLLQTPFVLLTGEYTPQNLLVKQVGQNWQLSGVIDFADSLIGPAAYDWLGPVCFMVQGQSPRLEALFAGYGLDPDHRRGIEKEMLALLFLHRYSNPHYQICIPHWREAQDLDTLAELLWPA
ncbi:MAG: phosphotransferase family protein [Candidatus Sericytochromatia bacterium]